MCAPTTPTSTATPSPSPTSTAAPSPRAAPRRSSQRHRHGQADGTLIFTPAANFNGATTSATPSRMATAADTATVFVTVTPVNDAPVDATAAATSHRRRGRQRTIRCAPTTSTSTATPSPSPTRRHAQRGHRHVGHQRHPSFTPAANFNGATTISYTVSDGNAGSDTATVTVNVTPVNDAPDGSTTAQWPTPTPSPSPRTATSPIEVRANDIDLDGDTLTVTAAPPRAQRHRHVNASGTLIFTPAANFNGPTTFSYTVSDGNGGRHRQRLRHGHPGQ